MGGGKKTVFIVHSSVNGLVGGHTESLSDAEGQIASDLARLEACGYLLKRIGPLQTVSDGSNGGDYVYTQAGVVDCFVFPDAVITYTVESFVWREDGDFVAVFPEGATLGDLVIKDDILPL